MIASRAELLRRDIGNGQLERRLAALGPVQFKPGGGAVIADAMWWNPNHFFRLRLFVEALARKGAIDLVGILRSRACAREQRALFFIGFNKFVYLEDDAEFRTEDFLDDAERMLSAASSHAELLSLALPDGLPAYTYFDTVLKLTAHPQPPLDHPQWKRSLAELLRNAKIYDREMRTRRVSHVVLSHPWKSEWASLVWAGLVRDLPVYHLTGFCEAIRIRRFAKREDYATPVEHLSPEAFDALQSSVQETLSDFGREALRKRAAGAATDINARYAYDPSRRIGDRDCARLTLSGQTKRPVAIVYGHVWYDFPHTFAMTNFTDFLDWINVTIERIGSVDDVVWLLKPHPTEKWYGGFNLARVASQLPAHVRLLPIETEAQTALRAADAVVTVHGTIGMEAAACGLPVLLADRSHFSNWGIAHTARDREDYLRRLGEIVSLPAPLEAARRRAEACFALALAEPPAEVGALRMSCDSSGAALCDEIIARLDRDAEGLEREVTRIGAFLQQSAIDSYGAYHLVATARRVASSRTSQKGRQGLRF